VSDPFVQAANAPMAYVSTAMHTLVNMLHKTFSKAPLQARLFPRFQFAVIGCCLSRGQPSSGSKQYTGWPVWPGLVHSQE